MANWYVTQAGALALQGAGLPGWTNLKADLFTASPIAPGRQAVIGDFTLAGYTGYAQASVTLTGGWVEGPNGPVYAVSGAVAFAGPSSGAGVDVTGAVLQDGTSHTVWAWLTFDTSIPMQRPTDHLEFLLRLNEDESADVVLVS